MASQPMKRRAVTVYCGSSGLAEEAYRAVAVEVGTALAARGWEVVYGGGSVGLMGLLADAALAAAGRVTGVITRQLMGFEVAHQGLSELRIVDSMHGRKESMAALCDGFLVLPGGFGTLDELFEAVSWRQLGLHEKPVVLLNAHGFFDGLLAFLQVAARAGFIRPAHLGLVTPADTIASALHLLEYPGPPPAVGARWWMDGVDPLRP